MKIQKLPPEGRVSKVEEDLSTEAISLPLRNSKEKVSKVVSFASPKKAESQLEDHSFAVIEPSDLDVRIQKFRQGRDERTPEEMGDDLQKLAEHVKQLQFEFDFPILSELEPQGESFAANLQHLAEQIREGG